MVYFFIFVNLNKYNGCMKNIFINFCIVVKLEYFDVFCFNYKLLLFMIVFYFYN